MAQVLRPCSPARLGAARGPRPPGFDPARVGHVSTGAACARGKFEGPPRGLPVPGGARRRVPWVVGHLSRRAACRDLLLALALHSVAVLENLELALLDPELAHCRGPFRRSTLDTRRAVPASFY